MKIKCILFSLILFVSIHTIAQDCEPYIPMEEGVEFEMETYNAKGKLDSKSKQKIIKKTNVDGNLEATIHVDIYDKKDKLTSSTDYKIVCKNGIFMVDMQTMLDPEQMAAYTAMEVKVDGDFLEIPSNLSAGQKLNDGHLKVTVTMQAMPIAKITIDVTNRIVEKMESITTPAGTFDCAKITYDVASKVSFIKVNVSVKEWYSKGVGLVKTESYKQKDGKLMSYSLLTNFKK